MLLRYTLLLILMTRKTTKMLILTAVLTIVIVPSSVYAGSFNEHQVEKVSGDMGKVADGTFDEKVAQDRLEYLMRDQIETGVSHEEEITAIETEYQKLYHMDIDLRNEYQTLADILNEKIAIHHYDKTRADEKRWAELPITTVGVSSKTDSIRIGLDKNYVNEADLPQWEKRIKNMLSNQDVKLTFSIGSAPTLDSHTSNRESTTVDPLKGGASVGFRDGSVQIGCTVGYMATENGSGDEGFVSAGHCTEDDPGYGQTGTNQQPISQMT